MERNRQLGNSLLTDNSEPIGCLTRTNSDEYQSQYGNAEMILKKLIF